MSDTEIESPAADARLCAPRLPDVTSVSKRVELRLAPAEREIRPSLARGILWALAISVPFWLAVAAMIFLI